MLNFLRGVNLENCYVILDEAQNVSPMQIKTLVTRISDNCKMIVQGDLTQCDKFKTNGEIPKSSIKLKDVFNTGGFGIITDQMQYITKTFFK